MGSEQHGHSGPPVPSSWDSLDGKAKEHVVSFLGPRGCTSMRAASSHCRQLVNQCVSSVNISRGQLGPARTLRLPTRFPNLAKLKITDDGVERGAAFPRADLFYMFSGDGCFSKLTALDLKRCIEVDVLALCVVLKAVPNLQSLAIRLPCSPKAPAAVAEAIAQLSNLQSLDLSDGDAQVPDESEAVELSPLTSLQSLASITLESVSWQVMEVVSKLANLTSLTIRRPIDEPDYELELFADLTRLQALTLEDGWLDWDSLCHMLIRLPALRSFIAVGVRDSDANVTDVVPAVAAATQLTELDLDLYESDEPENDDFSATFEGCLRMPSLKVLSLSWLVGELDSRVLSVPAACSSTLKSLHLCVMHCELALSLLSSVAFRSLKLTELQLWFDFATAEESWDKDEFSTVFVDAVCSQVSLSRLELNVEQVDEVDTLDWQIMWQKIGSHCKQIQHVELGATVMPLHGLAHILNLESLQNLKFREPCFE